MSFLTRFIPSKSALIHLRFIYSLFLVPVFLFALSQVAGSSIYFIKAWLVFFILHFMVYPASNGYNSYFDQDEGSIGGVAEPPPVDKSLYTAAISLEILALLLALLVSPLFALGILIYGIFSKLYSHPRIRLKKDPVLSFLVVFIFQGFFVFFLSIQALTAIPLSRLFSIENLTGGLFSSCLIGAMYVLSQIYQHKEDSERGDRTLSLVLGIRGSFVFSAACFLIGAGLLFFYFQMLDRMFYFYVFIACTIPVLGYFFLWAFRAWNNEQAVGHKEAMQMTGISCLCLSACFILYLFI